MVSPTVLGRQTLTRAYRRLPARARAGASALLHGETALQKKAVRRVRAASSRLRIEGYGDQVVGGALHPHRAVTVNSFDAWHHLDAMRDVVVTALERASIDVFELPNQTTHVLIVSTANWASAWKALSTSTALRTYWAKGNKGRPRPVADHSAAPAHDAFRIFQHLCSTDGDLVADQRIHVRLERWTAVPDDVTPRGDGGFHEAGTLLISSAQNTFASYLSAAVQERIRARPGQPIQWHPTIDAVTEPVDIVYTWVDGSDPAWLARRAEYDGSSGVGTSDSQISARFENRDELRFSLRSLEMYAGWYNRIFLVTDGQIPSWLNTDHPRLTVVDHRDLFEAFELPVFNSHAIESRLHHIEGLSELFIYMNDDVFLGRPVRPELFFTGAGHVKFFPSRAHIDPDARNGDDVSVTAAAKNNRHLLEDALGRTFSTKLKHTPHALSKSLLQEMEDRFPEVFRANVHARFRSHDDHSVVSSLVQRYGAATGCALEGQIRYNYADISRADIPHVLERWQSSRDFDAWCLNDTGRRVPDAPDGRPVLQHFLRRYFPLPSDLEDEGRALPEARTQGDGRPQARSG